MNYYGGYKPGYYSRGLSGKGFIYYLILAGIVILMIAIPTMDDVRNFFSASAKTKVSASYQSEIVTKKQQVESSQTTTKEEPTKKYEGYLPDDYEENRKEMSGIDYDTELSPAGDINEF